MEDVNEAQVLEEYKPKDGLIDLDILKPLLEKEMVANKLNMYLFTNEEIQQYHKLKRNDFSIVLLAKNKTNALTNLKNLRRCYAVRDRADGSLQDS